MEAQRTDHDVGEIMRRWGSEYASKHKLFREQRRAMLAMASCRTAVLGGHAEACEECGTERQSYNSCRDRHCPKCGGIKARRWLHQQLGDLLPVTYFHSVFTLPNTLNVLVPRNEKVIYGTLFEAAAKTLKDLAAKHWGAEPGIVAVLHTWGQTMTLHPHVHCIVTGGGLSLDRERWVSSPSDEFLFDVHECSAAFRKRFCRLLRRRHGKLKLQGSAEAYAKKEDFDVFVRSQEARPWVVYTQPPAAGEAKVLCYLSRYVHRAAISNRRILDVSDDATVSFDYKDYADKDASGLPKHKTMKLSASAFIGRVLRHVLPDGFRRIRAYGILATAQKKYALRLVRELLKAEEPDPLEALESLNLHTPEGCTNCGHAHFRIVREIAPNLQRGPPVTLSVKTLQFTQKLVS